MLSAAIAPRTRRSLPGTSPGAPPAPARRAPAPRPARACGELNSFGAVPCPTLVDMLPGLLAVSPRDAQLIAYGGGCGLAATPIVTGAPIQPRMACLCTMLGIIAGLEAPSVCAHPGEAFRTLVVSEYVVEQMLPEAALRILGKPRVTAYKRLLQLSFPVMAGVLFVDT